MVLSISAVTNPVASLALSKLPLLKDSQAHATVILNNLEEQTFLKLGIEVTSVSSIQMKIYFLNKKTRKSSFLYNQIYICHTKNRRRMIKWKI